ncbi:MAG: radical protein [Herbinix sp.]|jgi:DNA repair photolyase|nr:radical protein [Herbinix sp.]
MNTIPAKTILTPKKDNSWFGIDYNMNLYKGCCHGCIYCDSRSDCYGVTDFDTVRAKEHAIELIEKELRSKSKSGVIGTGAMSDPYNPFEREYQLTRHALSLIHQYQFGIGIATKSDLVARDIDLLQNIKSHSPVICKITVTTSDDLLSAKLEPGTSVSSKRLAAVKQLSQAGIFTGILLMPVLPFLEDTELNILGIIQSAYESGARFIYPNFGVTLRQNQRDWFYQKLDYLFPEQRIKQLYQSQFKDSYVCTSPKARELWLLFQKKCDQLGILYRMKDIIKAYKEKYQYEQLRLFY